MTTGYKPPRYVRITADHARKNGVDWTSRSLFFSNQKTTIRMLERLLADLKGEERE